MLPTSELVTRHPKTKGTSRFISKKTKDYLYWWHQTQITSSNLQIICIRNQPETSARFILLLQNQYWFSKRPYLYRRRSFQQRSFNPTCIGTRGIYIKCFCWTGHLFRKLYASFFLVCFVGPLRGRIFINTVIHKGFLRMILKDFTH